MPTFVVIAHEVVEQSYEVQAKTASEAVRILKHSAPDSKRVKHTQSDSLGSDIVMVLDDKGNVLATDEDGESVL